MILDYSARTVTINNLNIPLSKREFEIVELYPSMQDRFLTVSEFMSLWGLMGTETAIQLWSIFGKYALNLEHIHCTITLKRFGGVVIGGTPKNMGLKKSFLLLSLSCLAVAFLLLGAVIFLCRGIENHYPLGGVEILSDGSVVPLPSPTVSQQRILATLNIVQTVSCILFPVGGLIVSVFLFIISN